MDTGFDISDPTDWHSTSLAPLAQVDAALRCQVCKDFYSTPMITSCSHTFCSLCIRRCLATDGQCPTCRSVEQEIKLRRNWAVQEAVDTFQVARGPALKVARQSTQGGTPDITLEKKGVKRKRNDIASNNGDNGESVGSRTRGKNRRSTDSCPGPEQISVAETSSNDAGIESEDGLVACPICDKRMKAEAVFPHLDTCENDRRAEESRLKASTAPQSQPVANKAPLERLPQLNYSLLKDGPLRRKLQELGIPSWGPRALLMRRHTEWTTMWNANCDSTRPRSKRDLLSGLEVWERSQGGHSANGGTALQNKVMSKNFDGQEWSQRNKGEFDQLIASARGQRKVVTGGAARLYESHVVLDSSTPDEAPEAPQGSEYDASTPPADANVQKLLRASRARTEHLRMLLDGQGDDDDENSCSEPNHESLATNLISVTNDDERGHSNLMETNGVYESSGARRRANNKAALINNPKVSFEPVEDTEIV